MNGSNGLTGATGPTGPRGATGASTPAAEKEPNPVKIKTKTLHANRQRIVAIKVSCPKPAGLCDGRLGLGIGPKTLGNTQFLVRGGSSRTLAVKVTKAGLKLARKTKKVTVIILSRDNAGTAATTLKVLKFS
jgi:hypothetical protein